MNNSLRAFQDQEERLIKLFSLGGVTEEAIMKQLADIQGQRKEKETRLAQLTNLKNRTINLTVAENQLKEVCNKVHASLDTCKLETKRLALDILNIQATASQGKCNVTYKIPLELMTLEHSSKCFLTAKTMKRNLFKSSA